MTNAYGKTSVVHVTSGFKDGHTTIEDVYFTAPFKIAKPFDFMENGKEVLVMSASAGLMSGDTQSYNIHVKENSLLKVSSQSFEKIHKMDTGMATRSTHIRVMADACLFYMPLPTIPFKDASFESDTTVLLADKTSRFILSEMVTCGRHMRGELFQFHKYISKLKVYCGDDLICNDLLSLRPAEADMSGFGYFEGFTHLSTMLLCNTPSPTDTIEKIRQMTCPVSISMGATLLWDNSIAIRILGRSAQHVMDVSNQIIAML